MRPIIVSELTRSFPPDEVIAQMTAMACGYIIGYTIGPCINFAFDRADFSFVGVHIKYANGASLVACFVYFSTFIVSLFFVSDLSREFDLKNNLKNFSKENLKMSSLTLEKYCPDVNIPEKLTGEIFEFAENPIPLLALL